MIHFFKKSIKRAFNAVGLEVSRIPHPHNPTSGTPQQKTKEELLAKIDVPFRSALLSMYNGDPQRGIDGQLHSIDKITIISPQQGIWIYDLCLSVKPRSTLEIGMAYGYSTLYFLAAATKNLSGYHTSIDPWQRSYWHGIGLTHANKHAPRWGTENAFHLIEDRSDRAATDLARANKNYDLIFIDGSHRFDDVLVDFYLYAQLCTIGGHIIFDDMWMSSVQTAVDFIRTNRSDFMEIRSTVSNVTIFQKIGKDQRKWHEFIEFRVSPSSIGTE
jgi:predicted O-methyltransferase YrrM